jgi:AmmeMemoRadiSam system protein A
MVDRFEGTRQGFNSPAFRGLGALIAVARRLGVVASLVGCVSRPTPTTESSSKPIPERPVTSPSHPYSTEIRQSLLRLARSALEQAVRQGTQLEPPRSLPPELLERKGAFVTLTKHTELRGCIGNIYPDLPLAEAVATNAYRAALNDPRFSPVRVDELTAIQVEVSVLSVPAPLAFASSAELLQKLKPHVDGVVLKSGVRRATFLPQVWEKLSEPSDFLDHLSAKAGLAPRAWREPGTEILIYRVDAFTESEPSGAHRD